MELTDIKNAIEKIFSKNGYEISGFSLSCPDEMAMSISKKEKGIDISFGGDLPYVRTKKFLIPISAKIQGVYLGEDGGSIKLKHFPDFSFSYDENNSANFGSHESISYVDLISSQIDREFKDEERRKIAKLALQYTNEWATIVSQNGASIYHCDDKNKGKLKRDCENFVLDNMRNSKEIEAKSVVLTFILMYVVLPMVIKWVIEKFFNS